MKGIRGSFNANTTSLKAETGRVREKRETVHQNIAIARRSRVREAGELLGLRRLHGKEDSYVIAGILIVDLHLIRSTRPQNIPVIVGTFVDGRLRPDLSRSRDLACHTPPHPDNRLPLPQTPARNNPPLPRKRIPLDPQIPHHKTHPHIHAPRPQHRNPRQGLAR